jgi:hypothetical protein
MSQGSIESLIRRYIYRRMAKPHAVLAGQDPGRGIMSEKGYFYTNSAAVGFSMFDFTLVFQRRSLGSKVLPVAGRQETSVIDEIDVISTPGHTKMLLAALITAVLQYEKEHGPIKVNDQDSRTYETSVAGLVSQRSTKQ